MLHFLGFLRSDLMVLYLEVLARRDQIVPSNTHLMKKEVIQVEAEAGFVLVTFEQQNIGWGKVVGTRLNNNYPNEWRIRS